MDIQEITSQEVIFAAAIYAAISIFIIFNLIKKLRKAKLDYAEEAKAKKEIEDKYLPITNIEEAVGSCKQEKNRVEKIIEQLQADYRSKKQVFDRLKEEAAIYDEQIQMAEMGFYKPRFDFDTSERYKEKISDIKQDQKDMMSFEKAIYCTKDWVLEGSVSKGKAMTKRNIRLTARAFNNECDSAISGVRWNNVVRMEQRITKAFEAINKLNESNAVVIEQAYLNLKLKELWLTHEYAEKKQQEKEEQQEIRRQMREEAKLEQELEKARKEEDKYNKLLEKAKKDAEKANGAKLDSLNEKIAQLNQELTEAHEKSERAKSMAEQTKRGHVYVISNIGSFGENVYKIGMTRRLEPLDRVKELGDASVPFIFDVHAMIHSEDAPSLEKALHKKFDQSRLNLVNNRKEFFNITLDEIENEVHKISPEAEFIETAEARDYRETQSIRAQRDKQPINDPATALPEEI